MYGTTKKGDTIPVKVDKKGRLVTTSGLLTYGLLAVNILQAAILYLILVK